MRVGARDSSRPETASDIDDLVRVLQVEPLVEPVPKRTRRPLTAPQATPIPEPQPERSDVKAGR
jgi:hypothetical protein